MVSTRAQIRKEIAEQVDMVDEACAAVQGMDLDGNSADTAATTQVQESTAGKCSGDIAVFKVHRIELGNVHLLGTETLIKPSNLVVTLNVRFTRTPCCCKHRCQCHRRLDFSGR